MATTTVKVGNKRGVDLNERKINDMYYAYSAIEDQKVNTVE